MNLKGDFETDNETFAVRAAVGIDLNADAIAFDVAGIDLNADVIDFDVVAVIIFTVLESLASSDCIVFPSARFCCRNASIDLLL